MNIKEVVDTWDNVECVRFAAWCARKVQHLNDDPRVGDVLAAIDTWLEHPSEENSNIVYTAACASRDAADSTITIIGSTGGYSAYAVTAKSHAASAATYAAYAAWSNGGLLSTETVTLTASYTLAVIGYASLAFTYDSYANRIFDYTISNKQMLDIYLSETLMREVSGIRDDNEVIAGNC